MTSLLHPTGTHTIWLGAFFGYIKCGRFLKVFPNNVKPMNTYRVEADLDNRTRGICLNNELPLIRSPKSHPYDAAGKPKTE